MLAKNKGKGGSAVFSKLLKSFFVLLGLGLTTVHADSDFPTDYQVFFTPHESTFLRLDGLRLQDFRTVRSECKKHWQDQRRVELVTAHYSPSTYVTMGTETFKMVEGIGDQYGHILQYGDCQKDLAHLERAVLYLVHRQWPKYTLTFEIDFKAKEVHLRNHMGHSGFGYFNGQP